MFNLYKIQLKEKCKELYEENLKLKEEIKKYEERYGAPAKDPEPEPEPEPESNQ